MLDLKLKELIQRNRFYLKSLEEVVSILPETDEALGAWVTETVQCSDAAAFQYVV